MINFYIKRLPLSSEKQLEEYPDGVKKYNFLFFVIFRFREIHVSPIHMKPVHVHVYKKNPVYRMMKFDLIHTQGITQ